MVGGCVPRPISQNRTKKKGKKSVSSTINLPSLLHFRGLQSKSNQESFRQSERVGKTKRKQTSQTVNACRSAAAVIERRPRGISHSIGARVTATWLQFALVFFETQ